MNNEQQKPPVAVGEEYDVRIKAVGEKGDGIARVKNFIVFVPGTKKGDFVKIKITKVFSKVGFSSVVEKLEAPKKPSVMDLPDAVPEPSAEDTEDFGSDLEEEE